MNYFPQRNKLLAVGDRHIVLQLRHVALQHLFGLGKGIGVLGFPDRVNPLDQPVDRT